MVVAATSVSTAMAVAEIEVPVVSFEVMVADPLLPVALFELSNVAVDDSNSVMLLQP